MSEETRTTVEEVFQKAGTIWFVSTSSYTGQDRLTPEDIGVPATEILDIMTLGNKKILPKETILQLQKTRSQVSSVMDRLGKHFLHFKSAWFVPDSLFLIAKESLDRIKEQQQNTVDQLILDLPRIKEEMIASYPILADANWPTEDNLRKRFGINVTVCKISGVEPTEIDTEELAKAKREFQAKLHIEYEEFKNQILDETKIAIVNSLHEISDKIENCQTITAATLKRPQRVIEDYLNIAQVFDLDDVKAEIERVKDKLAETNVADIRGNFDSANVFAGHMRSMADTIGSLSGLSSDGRVKRVVIKKEE